MQNESELLNILDHLHSEMNSLGNQFDDQDKKCIDLFIRYCMIFTTNSPDISASANGAICIDFYKQDNPSFKITIWNDETFAVIQNAETKYMYEYLEEKNSCKITILKLLEIAHKYFVQYDSKSLMD